LKILLFSVRITKPIIGLRNYWLQLINEPDSITIVEPFTKKTYKKSYKNRKSKSKTKRKTKLERTTNEPLEINKINIDLLLQIDYIKVLTKKEKNIYIYIYYFK